MQFIMRAICALLALATFASSRPSPKLRAAKRQDPLQYTNTISSHFGHIDFSATYDYVIVGGGTAGLTVARRLADKYSVAVIEAGDFHEDSSGNLSTVPADASYYLGKDPVFFNPLIDWGQKTTPQPGFAGASVLFTQGHTLGGSSARNLMNYQRGTIGSYQKWANMVNDQSFTWNNLLPYFRKSPQFTPAPTDSRPANTIPKYNASSFSSSGGPLQVTYPAWANPASRYVANAFQAIGLNETAGTVDGTLIGWGWVPSTMDPTAQTRCSSDSFFVDAVVDNANLIVYQSTLAKKVIFDGNKKAIGVQVETGALGIPSVLYQINATKEVIISSGTLRSPQLLMVSGIGPAATLQQNNIPVIANRPGVGQNMWDQTVCGVTREANVLTHGWLGNPAFAASAVNDYNNNQKGILTNPGADILTYEKLPTTLISQSTRNSLDQTFGSDWPDVEYISLDAYGGKLNDYVLGAPAVKNYTSIDFVVIAPFSRGNVTIASSDTKDRPIVNPQWLTDPRDMEVAVGAFKRARSILGSDAMKPIIVGDEVNPGSAVATDAQIRDYVMNNSDTIHHPAGTCKMGQTSDSTAVVDTHARVIGVQGLRVVDASIFALLPPGHPLATVYAIAEKIADNILTGN